MCLPSKHLQSERHVHRVFQQSDGASPHLPRPSRLLTRQTPRRIGIVADYAAQVHSHVRQQKNHRAARQCFYAHVHFRLKDHLQSAWTLLGKFRVARPAMDQASPQRQACLVPLWLFSRMQHASPVCEKCLCTNDSAPVAARCICEGVPGPSSANAMVAWWTSGEAR